MMLEKAEGLWHGQIRRAVPFEVFAWAGIELPGNSVKVGLAESRDIGVIRQILAEQSIGVLVDAARPLALRISEVDPDAGDFGRPFVLRRFASLIVGQEQPVIPIDAVEGGLEAGLGGRTLV